MSTHSCKSLLYLNLPFSAKLKFATRNYLLKIVW